MATAEMNPLPPGAANVEDESAAWQAEERRRKWKVAIVRVVLAFAILSVWEYGTDRWFDAIWFSSPLRIAHHLWTWMQDDFGCILESRCVRPSSGMRAGQRLGS